MISNTLIQVISIILIFRCGEGHRTRPLALSFTPCTHQHSGAG